MIHFFGHNTNFSRDRDLHLFPCNPLAAPLLCCPARNLGFVAEPGDHWCLRLLRARRKRHNIYLCPAGKLLTTTGKVHDGRTILYRASKQPVLVVNGSNDVIINTINSYIRQQNLPNVQLIIYPDSAHVLLFQYPQLFVRHVSMFPDQDQ